MNIIRWFREWRKWIAEQNEKYEAALQKKVLEYIDTTSREFVAKHIIELVRESDQARRG